MSSSPFSNALFPMSARTTILGIPHLMDIICSDLESKDIKNCAVCCKEWYPAFGPYRFQSLQIIRGNRAKARFLHSNSHLIRELKLKLKDLENFDSSRCTRLRELELLFGHKDAGLSCGEDGERDYYNGEIEGEVVSEDGEDVIEDEDEDEEDYEEYDEEYSEEGDEEDGKEDEEEKVNYNNGSGRTMPDDEECSSTAIRPTITLDKFELANDLIQRNRGLRALIVGPTDKLYILRWMAQPILDAIKGHSFLTKIKIDVFITCSQLAKLINHLPLQLLELDADVAVMSIFHHGFCDTQCRLFQSQDPVFRLRRLILNDSVVCFADRMFIPLLKRCPDLEHIQMPFLSCMWDIQEFNGLMHLLGTHFQRLSSLVLTFPCSICWDGKDASAFLREFSKGFQRLDLNGRYCRHDRDSPGWHKTALLETLISSATVSTIEVLTFSAAYDTSDHIIGILEHCPRLREFRVYNRSRGFEGVSASDLLTSMNTPWRCRDTLETLELAVKGAGSALATSCTETDQDIKQLYHQLRSLPKLVNLCLSY